MSVEISSKDNHLYKRLKQLSKGKSEYLFIEGKKLFLEAINSNLEIEAIYTDKKNKSFILNNASNKTGSELIFINNDLLSTLFTTDSKPTTDELIITIAKKVLYTTEELILSKKNLILLEEIQDPGNLGTILRSAIAFDIAGIVLTNDSANPFNTKVIRASTGAVLKCKIAFLENNKSTINSFKSLAKKNNYKIIATKTNSNKKLTELKLSPLNIFLFGNEGGGLSEDLLNIADETITIPHSAKIESLNVGTATSLILWEAYKKTIH